MALYGPTTSPFSTAIAPALDAFSAYQQAQQQQKAQAVQNQQMAIANQFKQDAADQDAARTSIAQGQANTDKIDAFQRLYQPLVGKLQADGDIGSYKNSVGALATQFGIDPTPYVTAFDPPQGTSTTGQSAPPPWQQGPNTPPPTTVPPAAAQPSAPMPPSGPPTQMAGPPSIVPAPNGMAGPPTLRYPQGPAGPTALPPTGAPGAVAPMAALTGAPLPSVSPQTPTPAPQSTQGASSSQMPDYLQRIISSPYTSVEAKQNASDTWTRMQSNTQSLANDQLSGKLDTQKLSDDQAAQQTSMLDRAAQLLNPNGMPNINAQARAVIAWNNAHPDNKYQWIPGTKRPDGTYNPAIPMEASDRLGLADTQAKIDQTKAVTATVSPGSVADIASKNADTSYKNAMATDATQGLSRNDRAELTGYQTSFNQARVGSTAAQAQLDSLTKQYNALPVRSVQSPNTPGLMLYSIPNSKTGQSTILNNSVQANQLDQQRAQLQSQIGALQNQVSQYNDMATQSAAQIKAFESSRGGGSGGLATDAAHGGNYGSIIMSTAQKYGVDPAAVQAIIKQESGGNPNAASATNHNGTRDYGIMQVNSNTKNPNSYNWKDPAANIDAGVAEFAAKLRQAGGDYHQAFHLYNGLGAPSSAYADPVFSDYQRIKGQSGGSGSGGGNQTSGAPPPPKPSGSFSYKGQTIPFTVNQNANG